MFQLLGYIDNFITCGNTSHVINRSKRMQIINNLITCEHAKIVTYAIVNTGHKNGLEIHAVYNNGVILIYNQNTGRLITGLIARIPQIERYQIKITKAMIKKVNAHINKGYNHINF